MVLVRCRQPAKLQMTFSPPALVHSIVAPLVKEFAHSLCRQLSKWLLVCAECQVVGMFMRSCVCVVCAEALVHHCVLKGRCNDGDTEAGVFTIDWTTRVWSFFGPGFWRSCTKGPSTWAAAVRFCYSSDDYLQRATCVRIKKVISTSSFRFLATRRPSACSG